MAAEDQSVDHRGRVVYGIVVPSDSDHAVVRRLLTRHPQSEDPAVDSVQVQLRALPPGWVECTYRVRAEQGAVSYPVATTRLDCDRLWEHTCCELFVAVASQASYEEWNFSPTGQHAHFEFDDYRQRRDEPQRLPAKVKVDAKVELGSIELTVSVPLPFEDSNANVALSPTVVLAHPNGTVSHWACTHPRDKPDFHHRGGFTLELTKKPTLTIADRA